MNKLKDEKKLAVFAGLIEGNCEFHGINEVITYFCVPGCSCKQRV